MNTKNQTNCHQIFNSVTYFDRLITDYNLLKHYHGEAINLFPKDNSNEPDNSRAFKRLFNENIYDDFSYDLIFLFKC